MNTAPETPEALLAELREHGVAHLCKRFKKPPLPSRLLRALHESGDPLGLEFIARYPLAPSDLLELLAESLAKPCLAEGLALNPRTPPATLVKLLDSEHPGVRAAVARNPNLTPRDIQRLLDDPSAEVLGALCANPALKTQHHCVLAAHVSPAVRVALIRFAAPEQQVLTALTTDPSAVVRSTLAREAKAEEDLLLFWADCDREEIQRALLDRRSLPERVRESLMLSPHAKIRTRALGESFPPPPICLHLIEQGSTPEREQLAAHQELPAAMQTLLSQDPEVSVRMALARNPSLAPRILDFFITNAETPECLALLENPSLPASSYRQLALSGNPDLIGALIHAQRLDQPTLLELVNTHLSAETVVYLCAQQATLPGLREDIRFALSRHEHPCVRAFAKRSGAALAAGSLVVSSAAITAFLKRLDAFIDPPVSAS